MPARPRTTAPLAAAAAVALGALLAACGSSTPEPATAPVARTAEATPTAAAPSTTTTATPAPVVVAAQPARATAKPSAPAARPVPFVADPWNRGYTFGFVWGAKRSGDTVTLTFDPAGMLVGAQAKAYYDAHPDEERFDFKILNDKSFTQTLKVPASAALYGNQRLGGRNGSQNQRIDLARLVARASGGDQGKIAVWLKRTGNGTVVYLAEQYLP